MRFRDLFDEKYYQRIDDLIIRARRAERRAERLARDNSNLLDENAILKTATASAIEPAMSLDDLGPECYAAMAETRLILNGIGLVRPRQLASGTWSRNEFEVIFTLHDAEALAIRLGQRRLSVPGETMEP